MLSECIDYCRVAQCLDCSGCNCSLIFALEIFILMNIIVMGLKIMIKREKNDKRKMEKDN